MVIVAFACWDDRIAPVFDIARRLHIVEIRSENVIRETTEILADTEPFRVAHRMAELQLDVLVCGAISAHIRNLISAYGIRVVPYISGELRKIIQAWLEGCLEKETFAMPGCGFQRRNRNHRRGGSEMGRGRHRSRLR